MTAPSRQNEALVRGGLAVVRGGHQQTRQSPVMLRDVVHRESSPLEALSYTLDPARLTGGFFVCANVLSRKTGGVDAISPPAVADFTPTYWKRNVARDTLITYIVSLRFGSVQMKNVLQKSQIPSLFLFSFFSTSTSPRNSLLESTLSFTREGNR
jgi:hypothetical protein